MNSLLNYCSDEDNTYSSNKSKEFNRNKKSKSITNKKSEVIYNSVPQDMSEESNNNDSSDELQKKKSSNQRHSSVQLYSMWSKSRNTAELYLREKTCQENFSSREYQNLHQNLDDAIRGQNSQKNLKIMKDQQRESSNKINNNTSIKIEGHKNLQISDKIKTRDVSKIDKYCKNYKYYDKSKRSHVEDVKDRESRDHRTRSQKTKDKYKDTEKDKDRERNIVKSKVIDREGDHRQLKIDKFRVHKVDRRFGNRNRKRSRSKSQDRGSQKSSNFREERSKNKLAQLEKLGIEIHAENSAKNNFYNPLTTAMKGKYAEQIQKRKLLWANKKTVDNKNMATSSNSWVGTTFTHDQDGKVSAKFKRLMGIKEDSSGTLSTPKSDILKKQEEMFSNMEQQYEVARATTHTQRGVGLGYASGSYCTR